MPRWAVVVPSNRPERLAEFEKAWAPFFYEHDVTLHVVRDEPPWSGIPEFIPRRSDMIRSWGFYKARDADYVLSLDDDVRPVGDIFAAYEREFERGHPCSPYLSVGALTTSSLEMRGFPYTGRDAECAVQYGGWRGVLDFDAITQIGRAPRRAHGFSIQVVPVPLDVPATCCAMNFAFRGEHARLMWQLPLYEGRYNRFGDIWSGLIQKKVLDAQGKVMLVNGMAQVRHDRASDPYANLVREAPGMRPNEELWDALSGWDFEEVTDSAADYFQSFDPSYARHFREARDAWLALFA